MGIRKNLGAQVLLDSLTLYENFKGSLTPPLKKVTVAISVQFAPLRDA
jgi:hypothetical protein